MPAWIRFDAHISTEPRPHSDLGMSFASYLRIHTLDVHFPRKFRLCTGLEVSEMFRNTFFASQVNTPFGIEICCSCNSQ